MTEGSTRNRYPSRQLAHAIVSCAAAVTQESQCRPKADKGHKEERGCWAVLGGRGAEMHCTDDPKAVKMWICWVPMRP